MKLRKILKRTKGGTPYLELSSELVELLEWAAGDKISIEAKEVWMYSRLTKTCTLRNITQESYDRLLGLISGIEPKNKASNREE